MSERTVNKPIAAIVSFSLIAGAIVVAIVLVITKPTAEKIPPPKRTELVNVQSLKRTDETVVLRLTGTVTPAKQVMLRSRVSGEVVGMAPGFIDGGLLTEGEAMLTIDPIDYELALAQSESALEKARFDYKIELGRQDVAKREWELLKPEGEVTELETELALRTPHLTASKAALQAAEANLAKARLDLERTRINAPFNAVVLSRNTNLGSQAAPQDILAELADIDAYWVTASVPVEGMDPMIRRQAKAINFGIIYGISPFGLARQLGITHGEAAAYIEAYFARYPGIRAYMEKTKEFARQHGFVETLFGRRCHVPGIKDKNPARRNFSERAAINAPLQGSAADLIKRAMIRLGPALQAASLSARMLLQVHDELILEVPKAEAEETARVVADVMEQAAGFSATPGGRE